MRRSSWIFVSLLAVAALVVSIMTWSLRKEPASSDLSAAPTERRPYESRRSVAQAEIRIGDLRDELLARIDQIGQRIDGLDSELGDLRSDLGRNRVPRERSPLPVVEDPAQVDERQRAVMAALLDEEAERARAIQLDHWTRVLVMRFHIPPERVRGVGETIARHGIELLRLERKLPEKNRIAGISRLAQSDCQKAWERFAEDLEEVLDSRALAARCLLFVLCDGDTVLFDATVDAVDLQVAGYFKER